MNIPIDEIVDISDEYNEIEMQKDRYEEWLMIKDKMFVPSKKNIIYKTIPAGVYNVEYDHTSREHVLIKKELSLDELLYLPDPIFDQIINDIKYFWENEDKFKKYNYTYKRGILLYGKPGCGKSSISLLLSQLVISNGGIVFYINDFDSLYNFQRVLPKIRDIQKNTPILCVFEDLDSLILNREAETELLNLLDGVNQTNNIVYIGNTNYPENLKERIINRPSRFDRRYEIGFPNAEIRRFYLESKINDEDKESIDINYLVKNTEDFSLAHLGELVKSVFIFNKNIDDSLEELKSMNKFISSTQLDKKSGIGFGGSK